MKTLSLNCALCMLPDSINNENQTRFFNQMLNRNAGEKSFSVFFDHIACDRTAILHIFTCNVKTNRTIISRRGDDRIERGRSTARARKRLHEIAFMGGETRHNEGNHGDV